MNKDFVEVYFKLWKMSTIYFKLKKGLQSYMLHKALSY